MDVDPQMGTRAANLARALLLAWLALAAAGLRAETGDGALRILMLGDILTGSPPARRYRSGWRRRCALAVSTCG